MTAWVLFFCSVQREFLTLCRRTLACGQLKPRIDIRHLVLAVGQCLGLKVDKECPAGQRETEFIRCAGKPQLSAAVLTECIDAALVGHCKAAVDALVMRAALGAAAATAQQHDARYEQHRRKGAGDKKERPSPLLLFDRRAAQLTPAEHFCLGHGPFLRRYSVILHCFTLLYFNILTSSRKSKSIGRPVPIGGVLPQTHLAGQRDAGLGHTKKEKSVRGGALQMEQGHISVAVRLGIHGQNVAVACRLSERNLLPSLLSGK